MAENRVKPYINPYIAGNPVHGEADFFGRADILRDAEQILAARGQNAVILFGQRRIGKTSILLQLRHSLPAEQYTVIYQDLQDRARQPMRVMLAELADEITDELGLPEHNLDFDDQGRVFQKEFLPAIYKTFSKPTQRLVLLFDEFDVLDVVQRERLSENAAANQLFPTLRRWMREDSRLAYVFALGRNLHDLDSDFSSTFKSSQTLNVSVLSKEDTVDLIASPDILRYSDEAIERIYALTNGHPHFTQLLCSLCADWAYNQTGQTGAEMPLITAETVESLLPTFYSRGDNIFVWIWDGLPAAERIVASTLAELLSDGKPAAAQAEIEKALQNEGVQTITRDLQVSPNKLVDWQLLQKTEAGYRFLVPVLHQWIRQNKPFAVAREEIDRLNPRAHRYFEVAKEEYYAAMAQTKTIAYFNDDLKAAAENLEKTLGLNPDHLQARILLGDIRQEQGQFEDAVDAYEKAYLQDPQQVEAKLQEAKAKWVDRLITQGEKLLSKNPSEALKIYKTISEINPDDSKAKEFISDLQKFIPKFRRRKLYHRIGNVITLAVLAVIGYIIVIFGFGISDAWTIAIWILLALVGGIVGISSTYSDSDYSPLTFFGAIVFGVFASAAHVFIVGGLAVLVGKATLWLFDSYAGFFVVAIPVLIIELLILSFSLLVAAFDD